MVSGPLPAPPPPERGDHDDPTLRGGSSSTPAPPPPAAGGTPPPPGGPPTWNQSRPPAPAWPSPPPAGATPAERGTDGVAVAALVTGVLGLLASFLPFIGALFSLPLGIAAIVLGVLAMRRGVQRGFGVAGLVMGLVALLITVAWWALLIPFRAWEGFEEFGNVSLTLVQSAGAFS